MIRSSFKLFNMKSKFILIATLFFLFMVVGRSLVSAVGCDANYNNTNGYSAGYCTLGTSLTFNGTYNFNMNGTSAGIIWITGSNVILDCNNSLIYGNYTGGNYGITSQVGRQNITIKNCNLRDYGRGIWLTSNYNVSVFNSIVNHTTDEGIRISNTSLVTIFNNTVYDSATSAIQIHNMVGGINYTISFNRIFNSQVGIRYYLSNTSGSLIYNNLIVNTTSIASSSGITLWDTGNFQDNLEIYNNSVYNSSRNGITIKGRNVSIYNNTVINYLHEGIDFHDTSLFSTSNNVSIYNNLISQDNLDYQWGEWGISALAVSELHIYNNTLLNLINNSINQFSVSGRGINTGAGFGNYNNLIEFNNFINVSGFCLREVSLNLNVTTYKNNNLSGCGLDYFFKGFLGNGNRTFVVINNSLIKDNYIYSLENSDINLSINEYSSNFHLINFTNDSSFLKYYGDGIKIFEVINKTFYFHLLTNALIYNTNGSIYGNSDISLNDGNINITLSPNNYSYVLDNFNLTEGVSRQNSPLNITGTSTFTTESYNSKTYSIDSDILNELDNLTFVTNSTSCPSTGDTIRIGGTDMSYTCSGNNVLVTLNNIVNGNNNLVFTYNGDSQGGGGTGGTTGYSGADEHLCYISFNYIQNVSQTDYSKIDEFRENYLWTTFREYLDNWQYYCSDVVGRSLKEDIICSRAYALLENNKGVYTPIEVNALREGLLPHLKISNNLLERYINNYETMCLFNNKPLSFIKEPSDNPPEKKLTNITIFFIILFSIVSFGIYMTVKDKNKKQH